MGTELRSIDFRTKPASNVTVSRQSEASYYGADGFLHFSQVGESVTPLKTQSLSATASALKTVGATSAEAVEVGAPDGKKGVLKITESNAGGEHRLSQNIVVTKGEVAVATIYLKAGTGSKVQFCFMNAASYSGGVPGIKFDLAKGTLISATTNIKSYETVNSGNGWWKLKIAGLPDLGKDSGFHVYMLDDSNKVSYTGRPDKYLYAYGPQFEQTSGAAGTAAVAQNTDAGLRYNYNLSGPVPVIVGALIEPEGTNLVPFSQAMDNASWKKQAATVSADTQLSPDGENFAFKIRESSSNSAHYIAPNPVITTVKNQIYTVSVFLKAAERSWAYFNVAGLTIHFDVKNGAVGKKSSVFTAQGMESAGRGWYRCWATFTASSSMTSILVGPEMENGLQSYTGNGSAGILAWGMQLETGDKMTSYIRTTSGPGTRKADVVSIMQPSNAPHDIFVQRVDGGSWHTNSSATYQVSCSRSEVVLANFYNPGQSDEVKEQVAESLFPHQYASIGDTGTSVVIFNEAYLSQTANKPWSLQYAVNKSAPVYRFQVNSGDVWSGDRSNKNRERSELYRKGAQVPYDKDVWLRFAIRIAPGEALTLGASDFCYIGQFHASEDSGDISSPPVLGFRLEGMDTVKAYTCSTTDNPHKVSPKSILRGTTNFTRGKWIKNVVRVRFSPTKGSLQWWADGKEICNVSDIGCGYPDAVGPYWKFGVYRSPAPQTFIVEYANMEVSVATTDVKTFSADARVKQQLLIV